MSRLSGMTASATWDPDTANARVVSTAVTVAGAKLGDFAFASFDGMSEALAVDLVMSAVVSAADTVRVQIYGDSTAPNPGSGTVRVKVVPYDAI